MKRKSFVVIAIIFCIVTAQGLWAGGKGEASNADGSTAWPQKTIQVIVPFSPGGDCDFNGRAYATRLGKFLGQTVVVTNVTGNNGAVGATQIKNAAPDGYSVLLYHSALAVGRACGTMDFGIDAFDLACIGGRDSGYAVCVNGKSPYKTLKDLVDASVKSPGKITMAAATGGMTYVIGVLLNQAGAKLDLVDLGGAAERTAGLLGGHVDAIPNPLGTSMPYIQKGEWRALAIAGKERNAKYGEVPTAEEAGYAGVEFSTNYFFAFPKGTPREIIDKFADACEQVYQLQDYQTSIMDTYQQRPYFVKGKEAYDIMKTQEDIILGMKDLLTK
ncbi:MAG: tripartite tricarboxylate transporter substrate binding protein [Spirochaetales bacterium]|jgi:tripartite-type tricarboxylate transporter receptor subunit TctC|nr:tripartite tricarboxylate transporter substrate binding protein [Spirochaetales bacterium]